MAERKGESGEKRKELKGDSVSEEINMEGETLKAGQPVQYWPQSDEQDVRTNSNDGPIAAIITRVWSAGCVNLTVFPDHGQPVYKGSVMPKSETANERVYSLI